MSALQTTETRGREDISHADVIDAVEREMLEAQPTGLVPRDTRGFMLGFLAQAVASFLNDHPEHRAELLPELDPETTAVTW